MEFLIFGGVIFWIFIGIVILILLCTVERYNKPDEILRGEIGWPLTVLIVAIVLCVWSNNPLQIYNNIREDVLNIIILVITYLLLGVFWSFVRWVMVVKLAHNKYLKYQEEITNKTTTYIRDKGYFIPKVTNWKESISSWIIFWPFSILRYIFGKMIIDLTNAIINRLKGVYESITNKIFGEDLKK